MWFRNPHFCGSSDILFKQCQRSTRISVAGKGGGGRACVRRSQNFVFSLKKPAKLFRSVQFLASLISFYFEIVFYPASGEKIIKLAFKHSVKLGQKSTSKF